MIESKTLMSFIPINIKIMFDAVLVINQYVMIINLASLLKSYLGQYAVHKFTLIWSKKVNIVFFL